MAKVRFRKGVNVSRVVAKIAATVLALYVGGTIITEFGNVLNQTASPFYDGLTLIGWTITDSVNGSMTECNSYTAGASAATDINNCITAVSGSGVLAVIGLIGIGSVIMEFVSFSL